MPVDMSEAATFSNLNPNTSDADALGGMDNMVIWGTNVSLTDTKHAFDDFLRNYRKKYRMILDGELDANEQIDADHSGNVKEYWDMLEMMLEFNVTALNLDIRNLKAYPPTRKLWQQLQTYPEECVPVIDACIKDAMIDLAEKKIHEERALINQAHNGRQRQSSSLPPMPSSDGPGAEHPSMAEQFKKLEMYRKEIEEKRYTVRPFGMDDTVNLRDLNPGGKSYNNLVYTTFLTRCRLGQTSQHQRSRYPCYSNYARHEGGILQVCGLQPRCGSPDRPWQDHRANKVSSSSLRLLELNANCPQPQQVCR
jgi:DNA replication licensing factor MCM4